MMDFQLRGKLFGVHDDVQKFAKFSREEVDLYLSSKLESKKNLTF